MRGVICYFRVSLLIYRRADELYASNASIAWGIRLFNIITLTELIT